MMSRAQESGSWSCRMSELSCRPAELFVAVRPGCLRPPARPCPPPQMPPQSAEARELGRRAVLIAVQRFGVSTSALSAARCSVASVRHVVLGKIWQDAPVLPAKVSGAAGVARRVHRCREGRSLPPRAPPLDHLTRLSPLFPARARWCPSSRRRAPCARCCCWHMWRCRPIPPPSPCTRPKKLRCGGRSQRGRPPPRRRSSKSSWARHCTARRAWAARAARTGCSKLAQPSTGRTATTPLRSCTRRTRATKT